MIPEKFLRCCVKWCSALSMSKVFHWGECFPVSLVCLFLCRMWFSWMALRENEIFHLRKVISSGLALALFPSDSRWKPQDSEHVVWFGESHSAHFWLGEDGHRCLSRGKAAWNEASLFIHKLHSSSLPPPPQQVTFFILFVPPAWILNTFLKELASTCSTGQLYPFCGASVWFLLQCSEILLLLAMIWERRYSFKSRKGRNPRDFSVKPSLRRDARTRLSCSAMSEAEKLSKDLKILHREKNAIWDQRICSQSPEI